MRLPVHCSSRQADFAKLRSEYLCSITSGGRKWRIAQTTMMTTTRAIANDIGAAPMSDHSCATPSNHSGMVVFPPWLNFTVFRGAKSQRKTVAEFLPLVSWTAREHKNESIAPLSHRGSR